MLANESDGVAVLNRLAAYIVGFAGIVAALIGLDQALAKWNNKDSFFYHLIHSAVPAPAKAAVANTDGPQVDHPLRIIIHITSADERHFAAAQAVQTLIADTTFEQRQLSSPDIRIVPIAPKQIELRCLKTADCAVVDQLASTLSGKLDRTVAARRMSGQFEAENKVRLGTFELWFPSGKIPST